MNQDTVLFLSGVLLLIGYLIFSAKTEMGTQIKFKWPWQK
jgi:hypothetical protein